MDLDELRYKKDYVKRLCVILNIIIFILYLIKNLIPGKNCINIGFCEFTVHLSAS